LRIAGSEAVKPRVAGTRTASGGTFAGWALGSRRHFNDQGGI
jgi:hypothetical protein